MAGVRFSNIKTAGLEPIDFYHNPDFHATSISDFMSTLVPFYKELLKQVIGNKANETFDDFALTASQAQSIRDLFENELDKLIPKIEYNRPPNRRLEWKGKSYDLSLSLVCPNNRRIWDYYEIIQIADECLAANKPMYLSLE